MKRLLSIEFLKVRHSRGFWLLSILFLFSLISIPVAAKLWLDWLTSIGETIGDFIPSTLPVFDFVDIWQNLTFIYKYFSLLPGFLVLISICSEYSQNTVRQNIIDGLSKKEWLGSKVLWILLIATITTLIIFVIGLVMGYAWSPVTEARFIFRNIDMLFAYWLHLVTFLLFCMFLALLIRRTGFAIAFTVFYVYIVEPIVGAFLTYDFELPMIADSLPRSATQALIPNPFGKYLLFEVKDFIPWENLLILLAYAAFYLGMSWWLVKRRDL